MSEDMKRFIAAVNVSEELQGKLEDADTERIVAIAEEAGFDITARDVETASAAVPAELSDEELEHVAGGMVIHSSSPAEKWLSLGLDIPLDSSLFHKWGFYVTLSSSEQALLKKNGYELNTNFWYTKGDFYEVRDPKGKAIVNPYEILKQLNKLKGV